MNSPFSSLLSDSTKWIAESNFYAAVLDEKPLVLGHVLIISKRSEDYFFDLSPNELSEVMGFAQKIAKAIQQVIPCKKVGIAVLGLETKHAHLHLVPISSADDLNFTRPKLTIDSRVLEQTSAAIKAAI